MSEYKYLSSGAEYDKWVYHKEKEPKIIKSTEMEKYAAEGWRESPAKLGPDVRDFGVNPEDPEAVQQLGETLNSVAESLNGIINLERMEKKELAHFAKTHLGIVVSENKKKSNMIRDINDAYNALGEIPESLMEMNRGDESDDNRS